MGKYLFQRIMVQLSLLLRSPSKLEAICQAVECKDKHILYVPILIQFQGGGTNERLKYVTMLNSSFSDLQ